MKRAARVTYDKDQIIKVTTHHHPLDCHIVILPLPSPPLLSPSLSSTPQKPEGVGRSRIKDAWKRLVREYDHI